MQTPNSIHSLAELGKFIQCFLDTDIEHYSQDQQEFSSILRKAELENPWFTAENFRFALQSWAKQLNIVNIENWVKKYDFRGQPKKVGLILAGNIPLVGLHDVMSVILSGHIPLIKLSSKDRLVLPFLLKKWNEFSEDNLTYYFVERLENYDAVIATGSNNTARYLEYYFKDSLSIIRKNRTSIAVLSGNETDEELQLLAEDIFRYFGLGCRNVTRIFLPQKMKLDRLFENFLGFKDIINHHKYANNYDYNKAVYLLNQDLFWDNNFVMLKEELQLFSPLSVINFSRYENLAEVEDFIEKHKNDIQCVVSNLPLSVETIGFGEAQCPSLDTYADNVDTMEFLSVI